MKSIYSYIACLAVVSMIAFSSCTPKAPIGYERTGLVTCSSYEDQTITVVSSAVGATAGEAITNSERQAFENVLFKGIPNCNQNRALVPDEAAAREAHTAYFADLLLKGGLRRYTTISETTNSSPLRGNAGVGLDQKIQIDLNALRRNLEKEGVIRKFGL